MKKLLLASMAALALGVAMPAYAQDVLIGTEADVEAGFVGGFAGASIGTGIGTPIIDYAGAHPVEPIYLDGGVDIGYVVPPEITIYPVEADPAYGYLYANDRVWIVDLQSRTLVQSPGYLVTQTYVDYALANPIDPVTIEGDVVVGYVVPPDVALTPVPQSSYSYVYIDGRPALVESTSRAVVWVN
ncbi:hypothetical protein GCM10007913_34070 [Devosia yakushimensis]|uniref:DUF1236 domain-containing protein n=1 Tax=Devosia yakushimensis TaxID=470028 RepID=A0ABQ5UHA3_9HYPH|nr:DUF1236 domain-containing protein [Devosia yakushimensis]GLQ11475.1 hypothetical protein GCM10007913_34070 [Devosia yakushimensis]